MSDNSNTALSEAQITEYLRDNPAFFERHLDLLALLKLPHPSGDAISLVERQVDLLRQQNRSLENKLMELVDIARDNQRVTDHLHTLARELVETDSLSDVVATTQEVLRQHFGMDFATVHFFETVSDDAELLIHENHRIAHFSDFLANGRPICGRLTTGQVERLFGDHAAQVQSSAMVPLNNGVDIGILGLGSADAERFHPGMGVFFLQQLGALVSSSLARHLD